MQQNLFTYRNVALSDLDIICCHRRRLFEEAGRSQESLDVMAATFRAWLAPRLSNGTYFGWIADMIDLPVAGVGMMVIDWPPHPEHPEQSRRGYILNLFVDSNCRRVGLADELMRLAVSEGRRRKLDYIFLHATPPGQTLYKKRGWKATSEMSLCLRDPPNILG